MINFNDATRENIKEHNPNWPQILDNPHRILIMVYNFLEKYNLVTWS